MRNKNGFTIIEITISLVILLALSLFIARRVIDMDDTSKQKIYDSKIKLAESGAIKYGTDIIDSLSSNCTDVTIGTLINLKYLDADDEYGYRMLNPLTNESMNNVIICVKYENGKVTAVKK